MHELLLLPRLTNHADYTNKTIDSTHKTIDTFALLLDSLLCQQLFGVLAIDGIDSLLNDHLQLPCIDIFLEQSVAEWYLWDIRPNICLSKF